MLSVRLVLCFFLLTAASELFKEDECTHLQKSLNKILDKEFEEVKKRKKFSNTIIMGKSISPKDFPGKEAGECPYADSMDSILEHQDIEYDHIEDINYVKHPSIDFYDTEDCIDKTMQDIMILILASFLIGITKIHKHYFYYIGNIMKKCRKNLFAKKGYSDNVEGKNKKRRRPNKECKKSNTSVRGQGNVALEKDLDLEDLEEKLEVTEERKGIKPTSLQKSSRKEALFTSPSAKCKYCKKSGGTDDALKKCRGCR